MVILGLTSPLSWNSAAAIVKDGKLLAAVEEERFNGIKHSPHMLPLNSVEFCLNFAKIKAHEVDILALGYRSPLSCYGLSLLENLKERDFNRALREGGAFAEHMVGLVRLRDWLIERGFRMEGEKKLKIKFYPHHLAHAASAYRCSGFPKANVITLDGQGEDDSGSIWEGRDNHLRKILKIGHHQSLGWVYGTATDILGFKPHSHEGKTMGLAAWGKSRLTDNDLWRVDNNGYYLKHNWYERFWKRFGPRREKGEKLGNKHKNIAFTVQKFTEQAGAKLAEVANRKNQIGNYCLAGGVTLNCDMNQKIWELPFVEKIFIQPAANDTGTAIGSALQAADEIGENADFEMRHAYWGPEYLNDQIEEVLKESKINYKRVDDIEDLVAREIARGKIVGWFQGRLEIGPRALGNRSILAHPAIKGMKDRVNREVKHREPWRPFAPSILEAAGPDYLEKYCFQPFMIQTFNVKKRKVKDISQTVHVDGTARPQSVEAATNPKYFELISKFAKISGIPAVLNTSFNDAEKPLVNSPREALRTFFSTGLDLLAIGDFVVTKTTK